MRYNGSIAVVSEQVNQTRVVIGDGVLEPNCHQGFQQRAEKLPSPRWNSGGSSWHLMFVPLYYCLKRNLIWPFPGTK